MLGWGCFVGEGGGEVFGAGGGVPWFVGLSGGGRWRVRVRVISWWREGGLCSSTQFVGGGRELCSSTQMS